MIDVAEALVQAALERKESRGSHQRIDFPERDDERFLKHSLAFRTTDVPRIEYRDVVITNWPPAVRVYGRQH
jgi:fumarate reductase flavoprotein subunit